MLRLEGLEGGDSRNGGILRWFWGAWEGSGFSV